MIYDVSGHAQTKFEFEIFVIILILSYLLSFKLVDYLADFKTIKNQSRIDIIFLLIFFVILFIPMSKINQDEISKQENRTLTKWKSLITKDNKINLNFGKDYEKWFNDRFNGRPLFIVVDDILKIKLSMFYYTKQNLILNKRNNWLGSKINVKNKAMFTDEELDKALQDVNRIKKICDENNIKLYILIAPTKEEIYSQEIFNIDYNLYEKTLQMQKYIEQNTNVPIILAYESLKELAKSELAYFKPDHHWTDAGAYQGYLLLMNEIKKNFPNIYISKPSDYEYYYSNKIRVAPEKFYEGRTYKVMDLHDESILDTSYKYFKHKDFDKIQITKTNCENGCWEYSYKYHKEYPNLYFYGNSFTLNLLQILPFSFKNTKNIYIPAHQNNSNLKLYEEDIKKTKPDVLVLCFSDITNLKRVYKGDK